MKTGWVSRFRAHAPDLVNLSVGGTTSITGLFRVMTTPQIGPGDVVVWEYALNEANHIRRGRPPRLLLEHLEHLIRHLRERGVALAPVVFTPRKDEKRAQPAPYYRQLHRLLDHYRLAPFDMSTAYRAALGVATLPETVFMDFAHYAHSDETLDFICQGAARAVAQARIPAAVRSKYVRGERLSLIDGFADDIFENSIMRVPVARPPITITSEAKGKVSAIVYFSTPQNNAFEISRVGPGSAGRVAISARHGGKRPPRVLLKTAVLPMRKAGGLSVGPGTRLRIETWCGKGRLIAPRGCKKKLAASGEVAVTQVAGVFVTTRPWWARLRNTARAATRVLKKQTQVAAKGPRA